MTGAFPIATMRYFGPDEGTATRCLISIHAAGGAAVAARWWAAAAGDIRRDAALADEMVAFVKLHGAARTVFGEGIWGCEHEAEPGFPAGGECGECGFRIAKPVSER